PGVGQDGRALADEERIVAKPTCHGVGPASEQAVVPVASVKRGARRKTGERGKRASELVVAGPTQERVELSAKGVVTIAAQEQVGTGIAEESVLTGAAVQRIVAATPLHRVIAGEASERVVALGSDHMVVSGCALIRVRVMADDCDVGRRQGGSTL